MALITNTSCILVMSAVILAIVFMPLVRRSPKRIEKGNARNSFPSGNLLLQRHRGDNDNLPGYIKRGKGIGSKDINGRKLQEEGAREIRENFNAKQRCLYYRDELTSQSNSRSGKTRWHHRGSSRSRQMFAKAVVNRKTSNAKLENPAWFQYFVTYLGKIMVSNLPMDRDVSLNLARQLSFK